MIVVDTNILAYLWLPGRYTESAEAVLRRDPQWVAPCLWRSEFQNILAGTMRRGALDLATATQIADSAAAQMHGCEYSVSASDVLYLVSQSRCSAYDCEFVALAQDLEVALVTADRMLLDAFPQKCVPVVDFCRG